MNGACTCGNLTVRLTLTKAASNYEMRQCVCSFCKPRSAHYVSDPVGKFEITVRDATLLERHRFASSTADFMICRSCDGYIGAVGETDTGLRGVVNINCLEDPGVFSSEIATHDFDGEVTEDRLARRSRNWTPATLTVI